jgi:hypothetical protein
MDFLIRGRIKRFWEGFSKSLGRPRKACARWLRQFEESFSYPSLAGIKPLGFS